MAIELLRALRIGYSPISKTLSAPGDRRRLVFWANERGHQIVTDFSQRVDVVVATANTDFRSPFFRQKGVPIIFDLVDAYFSPRNHYEDFARGFAKWALGDISGFPRAYSRHIRDFCSMASAVICSSVEQAEVLRELNRNTHVILDSHEEIPFRQPFSKLGKKKARHELFWEGQPATLSGLNTISKSILCLAQSYELRLNIVTDDNYFKLLNRFFSDKSTNLLNRRLLESKCDINLTAWNLETLEQNAATSTAGIIPIDFSIPMNRFKPENRLLIMWRLGIPCLASPTPALVRVARESETTVICHDLSEWYESLVRLFEDPDWAIAQVLSGQEYLRLRHSPITLLSKWDAVMESVLTKL